MTLSCKLVHLSFYILIYLKYFPFVPYNGLPELSSGISFLLPFSSINITGQLLGASTGKTQCQAGFTPGPWEASTPADEGESGMALTNYMKLSMSYKQAAVLTSLEKWLFFFNEDFNFYFKRKRSYWKQRKLKLGMQVSDRTCTYAWCLGSNSVQQGAGGVGGKEEGWDIAQWVGCLLSKHKALGFILGTT